MAIYDYLCLSCNKEYEIEHSVKEDARTKCELCGIDGQMKRLITCMSKGKVELYGQELKQSIKDGSKQWKQEALKNENVMANLVSETKFENNTRIYEKQMAERKYQINHERPKIKTKKY